MERPRNLLGSALSRTNWNGTDGWSDGMELLDAMIRIRRVLLGEGILVVAV